MKRFVALGALLVSMQAGPGFALEPEEAGRQARDDLDALLQKQRQEEDAAAAKPNDDPDPPKRKDTPSAKSSDKATPKGPGAVERRIPTICTGCGVK